jgi:RHS repeat-associated protein
MLTWDSTGQLTGIKTSSGTQAASYVYNPDGTLLSQTNGTATTLYLPGEQITDKSGTITGIRYYHLPGGITAVRTGSGNAYGFEIPADQHGTSTLYLDYTAQNPTWRQFDPYGNPRGTAATWPDNHTFLGDVTDPTANLTNIGARWYDPATGTFTSADPLLHATSPLQLNGYSYAEGNPVTNSDPTGLSTAGGPPPNPCGTNPNCDPHNPGTGNGTGGDPTQYSPSDIQIPADSGFSGLGTSSTNGNSNIPAVQQPRPPCLGPTGTVLDCNMQWNTTGQQSATGTWQWGAGTCATIPIGLAIKIGCAGSPGMSFNGTGANSADQGNTPAANEGGASGASGGDGGAGDIFNLAQDAVRAVEQAAEDAASSRDLSYSPKILRQMGPRGWTQAAIENAVDHPVATHDVWDYTSGTQQPATAYESSNGGYVVVNDATHDVVQVSDVNDSEWKPVWDEPRFQR